MIHLRLQNINDLNFHQFGGNARDESDFVADNLANQLLLRAYGYTVHVKGKQVTDAEIEYRRLFAMNRCNRVFAERAIQRNEENDVLEAFQERAWRFKRQVANSLSSELLSRGAGVADIAIYFNGYIKAREDNRGGYFHKGTVIVRLNQIYFNTGCAPYLEDAHLEGITARRSSVIRKNCSDRILEIINFCCSQYISELKRNSGLRQYASSSNASIEKKLLFW